MMKRILRFLSISLIAGLFLTACNEQKTYHYFMLHPLEIKPVIAQCQAMTPIKVQQSEICRAAMKAEEDVRTLLIKVEQNGQQFGLNVIHLQIKLAQSRQEVEHLQQAIKKIEKTRQSTQQKELMQLKVKLKQAEQGALTEQKELRQLLAILGLLGP